MLLTLVPLLLAGVVTLEICVLIGMPLNFANIIALPLLLGVGVAFKIYYIMAWRSGRTNLLQSSLTRAVIWSALTTATAFGSLWLSQHPGTSSMGKLLALSLVCTLAAAVLFQPALMGKPRRSKNSRHTSVAGFRLGTGGLVGRSGRWCRSVLRLVGGFAGGFCPDVPVGVSGLSARLQFSSAAKKAEEATLYLQGIGIGEADIGGVGVAVSPNCKSRLPICWCRPGSGHPSRMGIPKVGRVSQIWIRIFAVDAGRGFSQARTPLAGRRITIRIVQPALATSDSPGDLAPQCGQAARPQSLRPGARQPMLRIGISSCRTFGIIGKGRAIRPLTSEIAKSCLVPHLLPPNCIEMELR